MAPRPGLAILLIAALGPAWPLSAQAPAKPDGRVSAAPPSGAPPAVALPRYVPPGRERPRRRIGGGVRGPEARWPRIFALVPRHVALTSAARPVLFWWIDSPLPPDTQLRFYLVHDATGQTALQLPLQRPAQPGIQRVRLEDHRVELMIGVEYEWSIALEHGPGRHQILVATGWLERVPALELASAPSGLERVALYAQRGLWYDALSSASELIDADPGDTSLRAARRALLEQIELAEVVQ
jgi:hypothetical protein